MLGYVVMLYPGPDPPSAQRRLLPDPAIRPQRVVKGYSNVNLEKVECLDGAMNVHTIYQHSLLLASSSANILHMFPIL